MVGQRNYEDAPYFCTELISVFIVVSTLFRAVEFRHGGSMKFWSTRHGIAQCKFYIGGE